MNFVAITKKPLSTKGGDTPVFEFQLQNYKREPVDLTGASISLSLANRTDLLLERTMTIVDAVNGLVSVQFNGNEQFPSGFYNLEISVTYSNDIKETFPSEGYLKMQISMNLHNKNTFFQVLEWVKGAIDYANTAGDTANTAAEEAEFQALRAEELADETKFVEPYNAATTYQKNNVVTYNGHSFIAKQTTTGNTPPDPSVTQGNVHWGLLSRKGNDGTGTVNRKVESFTATTGQTKFTTEYPFDQNQDRIDFIVNGQIKEYLVDYTETSSNEITVNVPMSGGEKVIVKYFRETIPLAADIQTNVDNLNSITSNHTNELTSVTQQLADTNEKVNKMDRGWGNTYLTLPALQAAFPTGNTNRHLVTGNVKEVDTLNITAAPTASGNVTVTLNGVATNVAVTAGVAEVASLTISAIPTAAGNITVNLNGVATNIAVDPAVETTTDLVAAKIRGTAFAGWTTGGTGSTITFTATAVGTKTDATYSAGSTGATGTITTPTQGVNADTATTVATKIRGTSFAGWTTGGTGTTVTFTKNTVGSNTFPSYSFGSTGAAGNITVTTPGVAPDGQWYYWNGSAWTAGGIFQATGIADGTLTTEKFDKSMLSFSKNILKVDELLTNHAISSTQGVIPYVGDQKVGVFEVKQGSTYKIFALNSSNMFIPLSSRTSFLGADMKVIKFVETGVEGNDFTIADPAVKYVAKLFSKDYLDRGSLMVLEDYNGTIPVQQSEFIPNYIKLKNEVVDLPSGLFDLLAALANPDSNWEVV